MAFLLTISVKILARVCYSRDRLSVHSSLSSASKKTICMCSSSEYDGGKKRPLDKNICHTAVMKFACFTPSLAWDRCKSLGNHFSPLKFCILQS